MRAADGRPDRLLPGRVPVRRADAGRGRRRGEGGVPVRGLLAGLPRDGVGPCGDVVVDIVLEPTQTLTATGLVSRCGCGGGGDSGGGGGCGGGDGRRGCGGSGCGGGCGGEHGQHGHATQTDDECGGHQVVSTRAREGGRAYAVKVSSPLADPHTDAAERALEAYLACHRIVQKYVEQGWKGGTSRDDIVGWLRRQDIDPPCDWWTRLCADLDRADGDQMTDAAVARALLELVADCRHRWLRRRCAGCEDDVVGLARVWLRRASGRTGEETCVVTHVDSYPPYRRELAVAARPMPPGAEDLTSFVWQRWDQVCSRWRRLSPWTTSALEDVSGTGALLKVLDQTARLWWACDESALTPVVVDTACLGRRVIGFRPSGRDGLVFPAGDSMSVRALGVFPPPGLPGDAVGRVEAAAHVTDADAATAGGPDGGATDAEAADDATADAAATTADADAASAEAWVNPSPLPGSPSSTRTTRTPRQPVTGTRCRPTSLRHRCPRSWRTWQGSARRRPLGCGPRRSRPSRSSACSIPTTWRSCWAAAGWRVVSRRKPGAW